MAALRLAAGAVLTLLGLLLVTFLIARVVPVDPVLAMVGDRASPAAYAKARAELGLERPLFVQFGRYVATVAKGDFGRSSLTHAPILDDVGRFFPATIELATAAILIGVLLGVPAGALAAARHERWADHLLRLLGLAGYSVPIFWLGLMALLLFYGRLEWAAGPGRLDVFYEDLVPPRTGLLLIDSAIAGNWTVLRSALQHLALPALVLGCYATAAIGRMTRSLLLEQLGQTYVAAARARGLGEARILWRHALPNILVPLLTVTTLAYAHLLEGSVLTETVFAWPGIGSYITQALLNLDMNAVLGGTLAVGCTFILLNLLADLVYPRLDPRLR
jgi:peptide/nickel transport system permease protein